MKKQLPLLLLLALIGAFVFSLEGCHKIEPQPKTELEKLPAATQTGKYTFGCLVNGKAWIPKSTIDFDAQYQYPFNALEIGATVRNEDIQENLILVIEPYWPSTMPQSIVLNDTTKQQGAFQHFVGLSRCEYRTNRKRGVGNLTITRFDQTKLIVSGTFNFKVWNPSCGDTIKVTEGRFDIPYIN
jgi:hypothetical protein